jgi:hypothetical protein
MNRDKLEHAVVVGGGACRRRGGVGAPYARGSNYARDAFQGDDR